MVTCCTYGETKPSLNVVTFDRLKEPSKNSVSIIRSAAQKSPRTMLIIILRTRIAIISTSKILSCATHSAAALRIGDLMMSEWTSACFTFAGKSTTKRGIYSIQLILSLLIRPAFSELSYTSSSNEVLMSMKQSGAYT